MSYLERLFSRLLGPLVALLVGLIGAGSAAAQSTLRLVYTGNTNGYLTDCGCPGDPKGGLARRVTILDSLRRAGPIVLIDGGDLLSPRTDRQRSDSLVVRLTERMGYDALVLGDQDLRDLGLVAGLPWIGGLSLDGQRLAPAVGRIIRRGGVTIGLVGWTDSTAVAGRLGVTAPGIETLAPTIRDLKRAGATVLVGLVHGGYDAQQRVAKRFPQLDVVLAAHDMGQFSRAERHGRASLIQVGADGEFVGELTLRLDRRHRVQSATNRLLPLGRAVPGDADVLREVARLGLTDE